MLIFDILVFDILVFVIVIIIIVFVILLILKVGYYERLSVLSKFDVNYRYALIILLQDHLGQSKIRVSFYIKICRKGFRTINDIMGFVIVNWNQFNF